MPMAPPRPCVVSSCSNLDCTEHQPKEWRTRRRPEVQRIRGGKLQRLRNQLFDRHPLCVMCQLGGRFSVATIRDHIIPLAEGGMDTEDNTQALCQRCSDEKTRQEARRGIQRCQS